MRAEDFAAAHTVSSPTAVRLLPPYDPLVLIAGELAGTWRRRRQVSTVTPFRSLSLAEQQGVRTAARSAGPPVVDVRFGD